MSPGVVENPATCPEEFNANAENELPPRVGRLVMVMELCPHDAWESLANSTKARSAPPTNTLRSFIRHYDSIASACPNLTAIKSLLKAWRTPEKKIARDLAKDLR